MAHQSQACPSRQTSISHPFLIKLGINYKPLICIAQPKEKDRHQDTDTGKNHESWRKT